MNTRIPLIGALVLTAAGLAGAAVSTPGATPAAAKAPALTAEQTQFFETKVRPVLAANCYRCHSAEENKAKGGLTLDTREALLKGGENGAVLVPGDPEKSKLIKAISYTDEDLQMPPKGEKLSPEAIADLTTWVKMGAPDPRVSANPAAGKLTGLNDKARAHWAYQPVKDPPVPQVKVPGWCKTPVDNFILAKLEENGMRPSPPAAKETLIRRATYDLIGLPPTPEEVRDFVNDHSANAFEKVVDRLLASPHYGERWGRYWLDTARYSDTTGDEKANNRREDYRYAYAWTYRDWVINAFNQDLPYNTFLKEQIAADQMPESKKDPNCLAALGFLTVGKRFANPNDTIDERIDALSKGTMALTVSCARCHDHKFDPIPQADYYSLHGIFSSTVEPAEKPLVGPAPTGPAYEDFQKKLASLEGQDRDIYYDLMAKSGAEFRAKAAAYVQVAAYGRKSARDELVERNKLIAENSLDRNIYQAGLRNIQRNDPVFNPFMRFAEIPKDQFARKAPEALAEILKGGSRRFPTNPLVIAAFKEIPPDSLKSLKDVANVYGELFARIEPQAREYIQTCRTAKTPEVTGFDPALVQLINIPPLIEPAPLVTTDELKAIAPKLPVVNQGAYNRFRLAEINELMLTHPGAPGRAMLVEDAPKVKNSPIFIRGEATNRGPIVPRQFLEIIAGKDRKPYTKGSGRIELANDVASNRNPLTARVAINRIWLHHFGQAFVRTPDDLGVQSEPPSHPELLDYLASRFMQDGWSMKQMHKMIMLSSTYQQSSENVPAYTLKDPENRLLWRANLRRLDFEAVRDTMLQFTGKIDLSLGGKPVNLTDEPYSNRRSVYGYIDRGSVPELMQQFDFADPDMANSKRTSTIVPQQALFFMNSPMAVDVVRKVTTRPEFVEAKDDAAKVKALYEVLYQRTPRTSEVELAMDFIHGKEAEGAQLASSKAQANRARAAQQLNRPARKAPAKGGKNNARAPIQNEGELVDRKPLTPWEEYAQALLFTNEIAYVN